MELLILMASRPGELIRREEIVQELWGDEINLLVETNLPSVANEPVACQRNAGKVSDQGRSSSE